MTLPRRPPIELVDVGIEDLAKRLDDLALPITLGWTQLLADRKELGWPARSPEGDRKPSSRAPSDDEAGATIDYADPTGELAMRAARIDDDLMALQDHLRILETSLRALTSITQRRAAEIAPADPLCPVHGCDDLCERKTSGNGFRTLLLVGSTWCFRRGDRPRCGKHRGAWRGRRVA